MALSHAPAAAAQTDAERAGIEVPPRVEVPAAIQVQPAGVAPAEDEAQGLEGDGRHAIEVAVVPAQVERIVRFRALGLGQDEPAGGSIEIAALLDSNINRATRADALGTVISDIVPPAFVIPEASKPGSAGSSGGVGVSPGDGGVVIPWVDRAQRALGLSVRGQGYLRRQMNNEADFLLRASGSGQIYGDNQFTDLNLSVQAGPEYAVGSDRLAVFAGPTWRWYGSRPYSLALGGGASWQHPLSGRSQVRVEVGAAKVQNRRDDVLDGASYSLAAELDHAVSQISGFGAQVLLLRETARDPGFATTSGAVNVHAFRTFGTTTLVATFGYSRLESDRKLDFFGRRRTDDRFSGSLSATFGALRLGPVAPLVRINWERNRSSVRYYDFRRVAGEVGLVAAF